MEIEAGATFFGAGVSTTFVVAGATVFVVVATVTSVVLVAIGIWASSILGDGEINPAKPMRMVDIPTATFPKML